MKIKILCVLIVLLFTLSGCKDYTSAVHKVSSDPINAVGMGFIVEGQDGTIYYQDGKRSNSISRLIGSTKETYENTYGMYLNLYENYLYYRDFKNNAKLMRLEIGNPDNREAITDINTYQNIIVDNMIYANIVDLKADKGGLYRISLDGTKKKRLVNASINCMQYQSDYIYYCVQAKGQLFRIDLNGENKEEILANDTGKYIATTHFFVDGEWIYFDNANHGDYYEAVNSNLEICRIRIDGTGFEELANGTVSNIYSKDGSKYLLYINHDALYTMNLQTKEVNQIFKGNAAYVNVYQDRVYVLDWQTENNDSVIYIINMSNGEVSILGED